MHCAIVHTLKFVLFAAILIVFSGLLGCEKVTVDPKLHDLEVPYIPDIHKPGAVKDPPASYREASSANKLYRQMELAIVAGRTEEALFKLKDHLAQPKPALVGRGYFLLAMAYVRAGKKDQAKEVAERGLQLCPYCSQHNNLMQLLDDLKKNKADFELPDSGDEEDQP